MNEESDRRLSIKFDEREATGRVNREGTSHFGKGGKGGKGGGEVSKYMTFMNGRTIARSEGHDHDLVSGHFCTSVIVATSKREYVRSTRLLEDESLQVQVE